MTTDGGVLRVECHDELTVARFQWPGNRASSELWAGAELDDFFERERREPSRVIVLVAPPEVVDAANLDLCDACEHDVGQHELVQRMLRRENVVRRLVTAIRDSEAFVVAVVEGKVALRMAGPVLACDYRIAVDGTTFWFASRERPVAPAGGALWFLTRLVGPAKTVELVLEGAPIDAREARRLGLVDLVTSAEGGEAEALAAARRLAELPRQTLRQLKRAMVASCERLGTYFDREAATLARETPSLVHGGGAQ